MPARRPSGKTAPSACAASSMTNGTPSGSAATAPSMCATTTRCASGGSKEASSENDSSTSTGTGISPVDSTAPATATKVTAGMYTASPARGRVDTRASRSASVQLCTASAWSAPSCSVTRRSSLSAMLSASV